MRIIGVTGGIGSGKSEVSAYLELKGAYVIDADKISREIVQKGEDAYNELVDCFGIEILYDNGEINRKKLADITFSNESKLKLLNDIMHTKISSKMSHMLKKCIDENVSLVVVDVPLPVKQGFLDLANEIWVVHTDLETRIKRLIEYRGFTRDEALARIKNQPTEQQYLELADVVLKNEGERLQLFEQIDRLL